MKDIVKYIITVAGVLIPILFIGWILAIPVLNDSFISDKIFTLIEFLLSLFTIGSTFLILKRNIKD
jgi:hypothetical protein